MKNSVKLGEQEPDNRSGGVHWPERRPHLIICGAKLCETIVDDRETGQIRDRVAPSSLSD